MIIPSEIYITSFDNMKSSKSNLISLYQEFGNIKRGKYKDLIIKCREAVNQKNKELYTSLKNQLPAVTFCGEFTSGRKASDITKYNNLMILDIDYLDISTMNFNISYLQKDKYIMALWISPSGLGLKGIVKIDSDINKHKYVFNALRIYFLEKYKIELDKSGSDVSRLCFSSWDDNFFYNEKSEIFNDYLEIEELAEEKATPIIKKSLTLRKNANATEGFNKREDTKIVREIIKFLEKKDISITESYDDWIKVALGISYTFSYDVGEKYFLKICSLDKEKHSEEQSIILLRYCYNKREYNSSSSVSIGTIIYFAKLKGFVVKKNGVL